MDNVDVAGECHVASHHGFAYWVVSWMPYSEQDVAGQIATECLLTTQVSRAEGNATAWDDEDETAILDGWKTLQRESAGTIDPVTNDPPEIGPGGSDVSPSTTSILLSGTPVLSETSWARIVY